MMYKIYHVYGKKIGITKHYPDRLQKQGLDILPHGIEDQASEGCGAEFAGDLEKFWQWYYGLTDRGPNYSKLVEAAELGALKGPLVNATSEQQSEWGKKGFARQMELGLNPFQTGAAGRASALSPNSYSKNPNNPFITGEAGRSPFSGFNSGAAQKASAASPNHSIKQLRTCKHCGYVGNPLTIGRLHNDNCSRNLQKAQKHEVYVDPSYM